jgi:hypothetical protein
VRDRPTPESSYIGTILTLILDDEGGSGNDNSGKDKNAQKKSNLGFIVSFLLCFLLYLAFVVDD